MSCMRKRKRTIANRYANDDDRSCQRLRVDQGLHRLASFFGSGDPLRIVRHGKGAVQIGDNDQVGKRMPKLRASVLGALEEIGCRSGCHRLPERSFSIGSVLFPVCARCTGVFFGQVMAIAAFAFGLRVSPALSLLLLLAMGFDWLVQEIGWAESTNPRRLFTGIAGGFGLFSLYLFGAAKLWMFLF
jgi:uncharacterized membrane protein